MKATEAFALLTKQTKELERLKVDVSKLKAEDERLRNETNFYKAKVTHSEANIF